MEGALGHVDPAQPLALFSTMQRLLDQSSGSERSMASITVAFAIIAMFMALVGLYAVLSQSVASRSTEISVRVALGADRSRIVGLIVQSGMTLVIAGIGVGVIAAVIGARYLSAHLYNVNPRDPVIFAGVAVLFALVAVMACMAPSWRAATLDPIKALRRV
jgi:ABC-type antimicrobial peptide transport system permease subunit